MLHFASAGANAKGMLYCGTCHTNVKVKEVLKRPIFFSYNWGNDLSTQKIAKPLCERVFLATEMPYWLDIHGGMGFGEELVSEMRDGVAAPLIGQQPLNTAPITSGWWGHAHVSMSRATPTGQKITPASRSPASPTQLA